MAKFRTYKNGITGHRYKGHYIVKNGDRYDILNSDKSEFRTDYTCYGDCEWVIDIETAKPADRSLVLALYAEEIFSLSAKLTELLRKKDEQGELTEEERERYAWIQKIRQRKVEDRPFEP